MPAAAQPTAATSASLVARNLTTARGTAVILDDVSLTIGPASRIGVIGPNGVGKTTLLRILAGLQTPDAGTVARLPPTATVGYLAQEPERRPGETLAAMLARRTGVAQAEADLDAASAALAATQPAPPATQPAPQAEDAYSAALERYLALGAPDFEARAAAVCADLGLDAGLLDAGTDSLSGGQAARASLAAILLSRFDVLLLDEPTNDLDFAGLDRLEAFLDQAPGGVVVVSHDRAFLERAISSVLELDEASHRGTEYRGGWQAFLEARATGRHHAEEAHAVYVAQRRDLLARQHTQRQWAVTGATRAKRQPKDNDKAQRDWKINRTEKQASKVRITERALERLEPVDKPWEGWELHLEMASAGRSGDVVARLAGAVVERGRFRLGPLDLEVGWGERMAILGPNGSGKTTLLQALLGRLPLTEGSQWLGPGVVVGELDQSRTQLLGPAPAPTGPDPLDQVRDEAPTGPDPLDQVRDEAPTGPDPLDQVRDEAPTGPDREPRERQLCTLFPRKRGNSVHSFQHDGPPLVERFSGLTGLPTSQARSLLAKLGLGADQALRPAATLSPGERTRAGLALLMARGTNCLVLDEPTNHLDLPAIEQLEAALASWSGTLLLVTHDRRLLEAVTLTRTLDLGAKRRPEDARPRPPLPAHAPNRGRR